MASKLEAAANLTVLLTCAAILSTIGMRFVGNARAIPTSNRARAIEAGQHMPHLAGMDLESADQTLVMFLRADCHYCAESMPFYQRLSRTVSARHNGALQLIAVTSDTAQVAAQYLQRNNVAVAGIVVPSADESRSLGIPGTPTLVLVGKNGVVKKVWLGKLDERREAEVIAGLVSK